MEGTTYSLSDVAAVSGRNDGMLGAGNGGMWIFALLILLLIGGGGGLWGNGTAATQGDIQRAVDLNSIQQGQANIAAELQRGINEINANTNHVAYDNLGEIRDIQSVVNAGFANMQTCCCETKQAIMENRYLDAQNAAAIQATDTANTQKILDALATNRMADMQNQINQLQLQNAVSGVVRYPMTSTYTSGSNPFCGCNCSTSF